MSSWKDTKCGKCKIQRSLPICNGCENFSLFEPMTNIDRIQNMSVEEMADFLSEVKYDGIYHREGQEYPMQKAVWEEWLQAESEE